MATIPNIEPEQVTVGATWQWEISDSRYPAGDGWVLSYDLLDNSTNQIAITATANGDNHLVDIAFGTTAGYTAGTYRFSGVFTKSPDKFAEREGCIVVLADIGTVTTDPSSTSQAILAAINAVIAGRATKAQSEITLGDIALKLLSPQELMDWLTFYEQRVDSDKRAERNALGGGNSRIVRGYAAGVV